jgi:ABC-type glycerol-3-phosphate transport system substrate-binding protein
MDLAPYIKRDNEKSLIDDFLPGTMRLTSSGEHIYGFPQYQATGAMYYRPNNFAEAGLPSPNGSWTWEEFAGVTQKLTRTNGAQVTTVGLTTVSPWLWLFPWFVSGGVDLTDDYNAPFDSPAAIKTAEYLNDLF